jgi:hypothetical protein
MILRSSLEKEANMENQGTPGRKGQKPSVGQVSTKSARALAALRAGEAEHRKKFKEEEERLKRDAAAEDSAIRRNAQKKRRERREYYAALLGRMVMATLERQGMSGTLMSSADLDILSAADRSELAALIQAKADAPPDVPLQETHQENRGGVDLDLDA